MCERVSVAASDTSLNISLFKGKKVYSKENFKYSGRSKILIALLCFL